MVNSYPHTQYTRSRIQQFLATQPTIVEATPLTTQQTQPDEFFRQARSEVKGPIDLLYRFNNEEQTPAIGLQQVDGESDEEEKFTLVYLDPSLEQAWKSVLG